jgi:hypothetical protein
LVILLEKAPSDDRAVLTPFKLGEQSKQVGTPTAEAQLVVDERRSAGHFSRNALIRTS